MEKWDAYDRRKRKLGYQINRGDALPEGVRHLVVHMVYYNDEGEILIQRRSDTKELAPGIWAFTGGSAVAGETSLEACVRETQEELGFVPDMEQSAIIISYMTREAFVDIYLIKADIAIGDLVLQEEEVAQAKWVDRKSLIELMFDKSRFWQYRYLTMLIKCLDEECLWR